MLACVVIDDWRPFLKYKEWLYADCNNSGAFPVVPFVNHYDLYLLINVNQPDYKIKCGTIKKFRSVTVKTLTRHKLWSDCF